MAKIVFIQNDWFEYTGIMELSAILKLNGHRCELMIFEGEKKLINAINNIKPDIIAFSVMTIHVNFVLSIASFLKENGIKTIIIAGGHHPTLYPDFILNDCIDIVNIGEGEYSILELANAIEKNIDYTAIHNLIVKKDGKIYTNPIRPQVNLDDLPLPDRELYFKYSFFEKYGLYSFILSRGCVFRCNFCFNHTWNNMYRKTDNYRNIRARSVEKCIEYIDLLSKRVKISYISFNDSTFNEDGKWALEFIQKYRKRFFIPFSLNIRPGSLSEKFVKELALSKHCFLVRIGIEVGNEYYRRKVLRKDITNKQIEETVDLLKKYKIKICTYNMFALPNETLDQALQTLELNQKIQPYVALSSIFHPFPGIDLTKSSISNKIISYSDSLDANIQRMVTTNTSLKQPEINSVMNLAKLSGYAILFPILTPLIKRLIHLPPNCLFDFLWQIEMLVRSVRLFKVNLPIVVRALFKYLFVWHRKRWVSGLHN